MNEGCDDCNTISGDGCSSGCQVEAGYTCVGGGLTGRDVCYETCGDGICTTPLYDCDQTNTANGDGCS